MESMQDVESIKIQWHETVEAVGKRNGIFETLVQAVNYATAKCSILQKKCDRLDLENTNLHTEFEKSAAAQEALQNQLDRKPFVLILIDGDITLFRDSYVKRGQEGGQQAAIDLCTSIKEALAKEQKYESHWELMVRIYVNMDGLAKAYRTSGVMSDESTFRAFVKAFNKERFLFEFIDAGDDKEAADRKVQKNFELFWHNPQCKYIVLGASGDDGYAGFLREYTQTEEHRQRIVLLKGLPYPRNLAAIAGRLQNIEAAHLFRDSKLVETAATTTAPSTAVRRDSALHTYAGAVTIAHGPSSIDTKVAENTSPPDTPSPSQTISFNSSGHRVDKPVRYDKTLRTKFAQMSKRMCFDHHLSSCWRSSCEFAHGEKLSATGRDTLLYTARMLPCNFVDCDRLSCYFGHRCPFDARCDKGNCKFPEEMHGVDCVVATKMVGRP